MPDILSALQNAVAELRQQIVETITPEIGTYTFPDGSHDPAITVLGLGSSTEVYPPKDTQVSGLEVALVTMNSIRVEPKLDGVIQHVVTRIILKQFDPTKNTMTALFKLLRVLNIDSDPVRTVPDPQIGNIEVCEMRVIHSFYNSDEDY